MKRRNPQNTLAPKGCKQCLAWVVEILTRGLTPPHPDSHCSKCGESEREVYNQCSLKPS